MDNSLVEEPLRVAVVDDDPMVLELFGCWLQAPEWNVLTFRSGQALLEALDMESVDLVVADLLMPGMNGLDLLRILRSPDRASSPYFILVTADTDPRILERAFEDGTDDFIGKPCSRVEFLARVRSARRMRSLTQEIVRRTECDFDRRVVEGSAREFREVVATLAHDLRTPIGALRTTADSLHIALSEGFPHLERMARRITSLSAHLADTIRDVTDAFVVDDPDGPRWEEFDLREELRAAADLVRGAAREGVDLSIEEGGPCLLRGNPLGLRRLCMNALGNALRATRQGRVLGRVGDDAGRPGWIRLRIEDTGGGIPSEILPFLGQPLALSHGARHRRFSADGSGLGLAICRRVVARHGGRMRIETSPGHGTAVEFALRTDLPQASSELDFAPLDTAVLP